MKPTSPVKGNGNEILRGLMSREQEALRLLLRQHGGKVKGGWKAVCSAAGLERPLTS